MRDAISHPGVFSRRRLIGLSWRGIALTVLASLFVYLIACTMAAIGLPGPAADEAGMPAHHAHPEGAPEQADCCAGLQDASVSARQKNTLSSLLGIVAPFFLICCFSLKAAVCIDRLRPPADPPRLHSRPHLDNTLRPRAPPR